MPDLAPESIAPPRPRSETMLRSTWAYRFTQKEVQETFRLLGALFLDTAQEADRWDESPHAVGLVPESVEAAADDLESLALYLDEIAEAPAEYTIPKADLMQCHRAAAWAEGLRRLVAEIRATRWTASAGTRLRG